MFSRAITRRIRTGSPAASVSGNDRLGRELEPGRKVHARFVTERLTGGGDVGPGVADVSGARRLVALLERLAEEQADRLGDVVDARRRSGGDGERAPAGTARRCRSRGSVDGVAAVGE